MEAALRDFVGYYNNERYHEAIGNDTPADVYFGRRFEVLTERSEIKRRKEWNKERTSTWPRRQLRSEPGNVSWRRALVVQNPLTTYRFSGSQVVGVCDTNSARAR